MTMGLILKRITIIVAVLLIVSTIYEFRFKDSAQPWKSSKKPQAASYVNLNDDQEILKDLDGLTRYSNYKILDPSFFSKPTIFNPIQF